MILNPKKFDYQNHLGVAEIALDDFQNLKDAAGQHFNVIIKNK